MAGVLPPSVNTTIAIIVVYWTATARIICGQALSLRERDFVTTPGSSWVCSRAAATAARSCSTLFLPAFALGLSGAAFYARLLRNNLQDILHAEYVRVDRAKGLSADKVLLRHALPNAMLTQLGFDIVFFLSGVLLVEVPFSWPGIERQAWEAITNLDIPLVLGAVLFGAVTILVANIVVDIAYAFLDPRVRYG